MLGLLAEPGMMGSSGDDTPVEQPVILTVAPTPTPAPRLAGLVLFSGGLDAIFIPTPTPESPTPTPVPGVRHYPASSVEYQFQAGWADGGGLQYKVPSSVSRWVTCESNWNVVTAGFYLSLVQFAPSTWGAVASITGYWDVYDPYQHGYNAAVWALASSPGQQWPVCWWR